MYPRRRFLLALVVVCALLALGAFAEGRPWYSSPGPGQKAALSHPPSEESSVENWILVGIIVIGFGALTIRMLRYRREMEKSILQRLRREWIEGRALLQSGRSFLKGHFDSGAFPDRRATPRNGEREARA
jgi:hypothetical protein